MVCAIFGELNSSFVSLRAHSKLGPSVLVVRMDGGLVFKRFHLLSAHGLMVVLRQVSDISYCPVCCGD